ncbi:hypothetical protein RHSIM_Rhsim04G0153400 [Rhododendron simsii]|uniref:hAT-like transposase RNase-H fold domain-containing protein n=1 Tax=Rhododendron simsii TaxID=118357 RepID=A0A834H680_RHOSS|nr:hypothetical protein RHSIM_Rhsim04G0153400 [Rhododendron simsii]
MMDAGNFRGGRGEVRENRDPHSVSSDDDELPRNSVVQQGMDFVGEEAASNIVGGGTEPLGSISTPTDSARANSGDSVSRNSTRSDTKKAHSEVKKDLISELASLGAIDMEAKFRKYNEEMPPIFMLASVMDPRMKLEGVSLLLRDIGTNLEITTLPSSAFVSDLLTIMYAKDDSKFGSNVTYTATPLTSSTSSNDASWFLLNSSLGMGSSNVTSSAKLSKYLELESVNANDRLNFDILACKWVEVDVVATYEGLKWQHDVAPISVFGYEVLS